MLKVILKALLCTAVMTIGMGISAYAVIASFEYSTQVFGRHGPLVSLGVICVVMIFLILVAIVRLEANQNAEEK